MYSIGDKIVHPMHGAGTIDDITEKNINGKKLEYYILKLPANNMTIMVPVATSKEIGIRDVMSEERANELIETIPSLEIEEDSNWNKRFRDNAAKIKSGELEEIVKVIKALVFRDNKTGLSNGERKMLHSAKQIIVSELVLAKNMDYRELEAIIDEKILCSVK